MVNQKSVDMFNLLKYALFQDENDFIYSTTGLEEIYNDLKDQAVLSLTANIVNELPIDDALKKRWKNGTLQYISSGTRLAAEEKRILCLLKDINLCIMKGSAVAVYYPAPHLRTFGDIDILVNPKDFDDAERILLENGYVIPDHNRPTGRNVQLFHNDVEVELHQSYFGHRFMQEPDERDTILFDAIQNCEYKEVMNHSIPVFDDLYNGMILLHHFHRHIFHGVGIRHLIDWMMYVNAVCDDEFWNQKFEPIANKLELVTFAKVATKTCQLYLGLSKKITWCNDVDDKYCEGFISYLLSKGNFGKKGSKSGKEQIVTHLATKGDVRSELAMLQKRGIENWEFGKKHKTVQKFAWVYQLFIYIRKAMKMRAVRHLLFQRREAKERNELFKYLNVIKQSAD